MLAGAVIGYAGGAAMAAYAYAAESHPLTGFASPFDFFVHFLVVGLVTLAFYSISVLLAALRSVRLDPARLMADP